MFSETRIGETVMLDGGGLGNAVLLSIGQALRTNGSRVLHAAGYKQGIDRHRVKKIGHAVDATLQCCDGRFGFKADRLRDRAFSGNIIEAFDACGFDKMMAVIVRAWHDMLADKLKNRRKTIGSINSPQQCMMWGIPALWLQARRNPMSGIESAVFACSNQHQELDRVDFDCLCGRLRQNSAQEKITRIWRHRSLRKLVVTNQRRVTTVGTAETPVVA